jgi:hypothetical protein
MSDKLTFKAFLQQSKEQLVEASKATPTAELEYTVRKYCKLPLLEGADKVSVSLKPKHRVFVKWLYENIDEPTMVSIRVDNNEVDVSNKYQLTWKPEKIYSWLDKNTKVKSPI